MVSRSLQSSPIFDHDVSLIQAFTNARQLQAAASQSWDMLIARPKVFLTRVWHLLSQPCRPTDSYGYTLFTKGMVSRLREETNPSTALLDGQVCFLDQDLDQRYRQSSGRYSASSRSPAWPILLYGWASSVLPPSVLVWSGRTVLYWNQCMAHGSTSLLAADFFPFGLVLRPSQNTRSVPLSSCPTGLCLASVSANGFTERGSAIWMARPRTCRYQVCIFAMPICGRPLYCIANRPSTRGPLFGPFRWFPRELH
jgi:hypothetical protein